MVKPQLKANSYADMAELADALDLGSSSERSEGSSPFIRINYFQYLGFLWGCWKPYCTASIDPHRSAERSRRSLNPSPLLGEGLQSGSPSPVLGEGVGDEG